MMITTRNALLIVGVLGILASIYGMFKANNITANIAGLVCGACLIYGYFDLKAKSNN